MDYPREFDKATRAKLVAAEIIASRRVMMSRSLFSSGELIVGTAFRLESSHVFQYILTMFHAFAIEACALGRNGEWTADRVDRESQKFLRLITIQAQHRYGSRSEYFLPQMISPTGAIMPEILVYLEDSPAWQSYQVDLLTIARLELKLSGSAHPVSLNASKATLTEQDSANAHVLNAHVLNAEQTEDLQGNGGACVETDESFSEEEPSDVPAEPPRCSEGPSDEQLAAAEAMVNQKAEVDTQRAAWYLQCSTQHVLRLIREQHLIATRTKPKRIKCDSLRRYKWGDDSQGPR
jgi:hypothetical protein